MTVEQVEQQEEQQPVQVDEAAAEAEFAAGFAEARGDEPPAPVAAAEEPVAEQPTEAAPEGDAKEIAEQLFLGLPEEQAKQLLLKAGSVDEVKAHLEQRLEKLFGMFGEVKDRIKTISETRGEAAIEVTDDDLDPTLREDYGEVGQAIKQTLNNALKRAKASQGAAAIDPNEVGKTIDERVAAVREEVEREMETKLVKLQHKDFDQVCASSDFRLWMDNVLPPEESQKLKTAWDSLYIIDKVSEFKAWREKAAQSKASRKQRLEAAIAPTGGTAPSTQPSAEDDFIAGYRAVRGAR